MLKKHIFPAVDPDEPFKDDKLGRDQFASTLTQLIETLSDPFVLAINGPWGAGKTTFAAMWQAQLAQRNFVPIYFNAWQHDFADDPLVALMSEVDERISRGAEEFRSHKARDAWNSTKDAGMKIVRALGPLAIRIATQGILDTRSIENAMGELDRSDEVVAAFAESAARERLATHQAARRSGDAFRARLEKFADAVGGPASPTGKMLPLVFIIDELDRCKPTFAVALLERVKHFFNVPGFCFVLVIDREQLGHTVRGIYGSGMNADGYLRRFIDLTIPLPEPPLERFIDHLADVFGFHQLLGGRGRAESIVRDFAEFAAAFTFSLRDVEQSFTELNVTLRLLRGETENIGGFITLMTALRAANRDLYNRYMRGDASGREVVTFIERSHSGKQVMGEDRRVAAMLIGASLHDAEAETAMSEAQNMLKGSPAGRSSDPGLRYHELVVWVVTQRRVLKWVKQAIEFAGTVR